MSDSGGLQNSVQETHTAPYIDGVPNQADIRPTVPQREEGLICGFLESVVARRLAAIAEEHNLLPPNHFGGRPQRTGTDAVLHLVQRIKDSWRVHKVTSVLSLDISSAFPKK